MDAARRFLRQCRVAMNGNMETKMNSKSKVVFVTALAVALLAVPISAYAAQHQQAKQAAKKTGRVFLLESNGPINMSAAENFQNHFTIDY